MNNREIINNLQQLKSIAPSAEWKKANRHALLHYIEQNKSLVQPSGFFVMLRLFTDTFKRTAFQPASLLLVILVTVMGSSLMVNAAYYSLPGDRLYSLKIRLEKAQVALTSNHEAKVELRVELAKKRVYELDKVMVQATTPAEKAKKVSVAVRTLKQNVEQVKAEVESKAASKETNYRIALTLGSTVNDIKDALDETTQDILTDDDKKNLETSLESAENAGITALVESLNTEQTPLDLKANEVSEFLTNTLVSIESQLQDLDITILAEEKQASAKELRATIDEHIAAIKTAISDANFDAAALGVQSVKLEVASLKVYFEPQAENIQTDDEKVEIQSQNDQNETNVTTPSIIATTTQPAPVEPDGQAEAAD